MIVGCGWVARLVVAMGSLRLLVSQCEHIVLPSGLVLELTPVNFVFATVVIIPAV